MTTPSAHREFDLHHAKEILEQYTQPNSMIDNGNLFFAATEYQGALTALQKENEELREAKNETTRLANQLAGKCKDKDYQRDSLEAKLAICTEALSNARYEALRNGLTETQRCEHIGSIINEALSKIKGVVG
jgi:hypothetical protein